MALYPRRAHMFTKKEMEEINEARKKNKKVQKGLYMTLEDLRFATNNKVAKYRAKRLACDLLAEIGCSIGSQTIEFAKTCKKVIAIDVDERKIRYARENLKKFKNVKLICSDGLKVDLSKADIIFCDPERDPSAQRRALSSFKPNVYELAKKYPDKDFCIEVPPHTQEINLDCEREYVSVDRELNRLNLYLGSLKSSETSAVALPDFARIEGKPSIPQLSSTDAKAYLYEIDEAVVKAQLVDALAMILEEETYLYKDDYRFLTSPKRIDSPFFRNSFKVVAGLKKQPEVIEELRRKNFGKVVLRQSVAPEDYWKERRKYEDKLSGSRTAHLIVTKWQHLICEKLSPDPKKS